MRFSILKKRLKIKTSSFRKFLSKLLSEHFCQIIIFTFKIEQFLAKKFSVFVSHNVNWGYKWLQHR